VAEQTTIADVDRVMAELAKQIGEDPRTDTRR